MPQRPYELEMKTNLGPNCAAVGRRNGTGVKVGFRLRRRTARAAKAASGKLKETKAFLPLGQRGL